MMGEAINLLIETVVHDRLADLNNPRVHHASLPLE
jgi:hypothetical protein